MARGLWFVFLSLSSIISLGCSRESKKTTSTITIQVPKNGLSSNKVGAMAMPTDRKTCYGVVVKGADLPTEGGSVCSPSASLRIGFVEAGSEIKREVKKGSGRIIELFAFLQDLGKNDPCPMFTGNLNPAIVISTYKIGTAFNVDMMGEETSVTINAEFPGLANNYASEAGLPSFCSDTNPARDTRPTVGQLSGGWAVSTGGSNSLRGRAGGAWSSPVLSSVSGVTLKVK